MSVSPTQSASSGSQRTIAKVGDCVKQLLGCREMSDVEFSVGLDYGAAKNFPAHRFIMSMRSAVFQRMFFGSLSADCTAPIDIPDIHPDAFDNMLSYIYTDVVKNFTLENVFDTLKAADKYDLPLLLALCTDFILGTLTVKNCLHILDNAVCYAVAAPSILDKCLCLIDESATIWHSEQFLKIGQEALHAILQRDTLTANEDTICSSVDEWAEEACVRANIEDSCANRREMLGSALFLVGFPLLTDGQLLIGPAMTGLLLRSEILDIYHFKYADIKPLLPFRTEPRQNVRAKGVINYTIPDVRMPLETTNYSRPVTVRKLLWSIGVRTKSDGSNTLQFGLLCSAPDYPKAASWTCQADAELRLLPWNMETAPVKKEISRVFSKEKFAWGFRYTNKGELLNPAKGYVNPHDYSLKLEVHLTAGLPDGID